MTPDVIWAQEILHAIRRIHQYIEAKDACYEIDVSSELNLLWKNFISNGVQLEYAETDHIRDARMKQMLHWIHSHYAEKIKLEDIARAGQLSRSECCRYFKRLLKTSPLQYVIDYRIQQSLLLLQQQDNTVTDVAFQVGFNSTSYFIDTFRKTIGMTPHIYKKHHEQVSDA
ncbi:AraC-like DNA-binding protein [Scopulibacillus daqui]|uniref:AraC-like DNA-binding protein n=1 Tax=Scopulibacillus daqui TaxID=1469162 RepID=A0ABS2Q249_9BACL|nr:AraC-like DNA-binding protein [Scopulibacillus daqui]